MRGIKVLDLSWLLPGPYATMLMADLGADVIKIEQPGRGDYEREINPEMFRVANRNKRSMTLNLKHPAGREILYRLVQDADVLVEGFRPGVMKRLEADYDTLAWINPRLIYCSLSGYGQDGPYRDWPGHDTNYAGLAGALAIAGDLKYPPVRPGLPIGDLTSGTFACLAVLDALCERHATGRGQYLDCSITECVASWSQMRMADVLWNNEPPHYAPNATSRVYSARDGQRLSLAVTAEDHFWRKLCQALERDDLLTDPRFETARNRAANGPALLPILEAEFAKRDRDEWLTLLREFDVPAAPVHELEDVVRDPHFEHRGLFWKRTDATGQERRVIRFPVKFSETQPSWRLMPPELGEHTAAVLTAAGFTPEQIAMWRAEGTL